jgi:molecular chaperone DnaK
MGEVGVSPPRARQNVESYVSEARKDPRAPVTLRIKFKSPTLGNFIERYSVDVSRGGIFIRTKQPLAIGTPLRFEFQLQDGQALISGEGTVIWIREDDPTRAGQAPGMGVRLVWVSGSIA